MDLTENILTAEHISQMTGVNGRRLHQWIGRGYVPEPGVSHGRGKPREYNRMTAYIAGWLNVFEKFGVPLALARTWIDAYLDEFRKYNRGEVTDRPVYIIFRHDKEHLFHFIRESQIHNKLSTLMEETGGATSIIDLAQITDHVDEWLAKNAPTAGSA